MNYVKKLSIASAAAIPSDFKLKENGFAMPLMRVYGQVEGTDTGVSQFGPWTAFIGNFKGVRLEDGEVFRSKKLLVPELAEMALTDGLENSEEGAILEFALEIGIRRTIRKNAQDVEVGAGYEYTMKPLIEIDEAVDPLSALESKVLAALPAPKTDDETQPESSVKPGKSGKK